MISFTKEDTPGELLFNHKSLANENHPFLITSGFKTPRQKGSSWGLIIRTYTPVSDVTLATACAHYNLSVCIDFNGTEWQMWIISFLSKWVNSKEDGKYSFADYTYKMYNLHIYIKLRQAGDLSMVYPTSHTMTLRLTPPTLLMSEMPEANLKTWINKSRSNFIKNK